MASVTCGFNQLYVTLIPDLSQPCWPVSENR